MLHTMFEDDVIPLFENHAEVKSAVRVHIYELLYGRPYDYAVNNSSSGRSEPETMSPMPYESGGQVKPYIPPTNPEDLAGVLEPPMGG